VIAITLKQQARRIRLGSSNIEEPQELFAPKASDGSVPKFDPKPNHMPAPCQTRETGRGDEKKFALRGSTIPDPHERRHRDGHIEEMGYGAGSQRKTLLIPA